MVDGAPPTVTCRGVTKQFGAVRVLDGVDLTLEAGAVTALVGANGAGKTTMFHVIAGAMRPDSGQVHLRGRRIDGLASWEVARRGVGRLLQDVRVFPHMTVLDNVRTAVAPQAGEDAISVLTEWRRVIGQRHDVTTRARLALDCVDLLSFEARPAQELSYGLQKLLAIARVLASDVPVMLLDEPMAGINPIVQRRVGGLVRSLAREGRTVALIEHDLIAVRELADTVLFMDEGRIRASGRPETVLADPGVRASYLGLE